MPSFTKMTVQKQFLLVRRAYYEVVVAMAVHCQPISGSI